MFDKVSPSGVLEVNGEHIPVSEALELIRMLCNDAKQIAGEFHNMERSDKFRANWPNENTFAESEWKNFVEPVRQMYAEMLGNPKTPPADARKMHLAIVLYTMAEQGAEKAPHLQIARNSEQFHGDRAENRKIIEKFGKQSMSFRELAMSSTARRYH